MRRETNSLAAAIRGPITLITVGALLALNNFTPFSFRQTWPVILIVFGLFTLLGRRSAGPAAPQQPYGYQPPAGYSQQPVPPAQSPNEPQNPGGAL